MFGGLPSGGKIDLTCEGGALASVTLGASNNKKTFKLAGVKSAVAGKFWPLAARLNFKITGVGTQAASGTSIAYHDVMAQVVKTINVTVPRLGNIFSSADYKGAILDNVYEVAQNGHDRPRPINDPIASSAGDKSFTVQLTIPFYDRCRLDPTDTMPWLGFLDGMAVDVELCNANDALQTGFVAKSGATFTVRVWIEYLVARKFQLHVPATWKLYEHTSSGSSVQMVNCGVSGIPSGRTQPGARLGQVFWLSSLIGLGGVTTVDKIATYANTWRDQVVTDYPGDLLRAFIENVGRKGPTGSVAASALDSNRLYYQMGGVGPANGDYLLATAEVFPVLASGPRTNPRRFQSAKNTLDTYFTWTQATSGAHRMVARENYAFTPDAIKDLAAEAGINSGDLVAITPTGPATDWLTNSESQGFKLVKRA